MMTKEQARDLALEMGRWDGASEPLSLSGMTPAEVRDLALRTMCEPQECGRCGRADLPLMLLPAHDRSCRMEHVRDPSELEEDFGDLMTSLSLKMAIWPNHWCQDVAVVAFMIDELSRRVSDLEEQVRTLGGEPVPATHGRIGDTF